LHLKKKYEGEERQRIRTDEKNCRTRVRSRSWQGMGVRKRIGGNGRKVWKWDSKGNKLAWIERNRYRRVRGMKQAAEVEMEEK
jgi:hypothetical protein